MSAEPARPTPNTKLAPKVARWVGLLLLFPVAWMYLASGLIAPLWAVVALGVIWIIMVGASIWAWRKHPWLVLLAPIIAMAIWFAFMWLGGTFLGWTA